MYRHESSKTHDRPQSSHLAAKTAEKNVAVPISNQFALSRNITQMQSVDSAPDELHSKLTKRIGSLRNNGLPAQLQNGIENLSGYSMDNVRVHYNSPRPAQLQALAYAKGEDIYVAPGQEKHLPHEAWHIVQQKQGRAVPTGRLNGVNINDDPSLEHEADVMGAKAVQLRTDESSDALQMQKAQEPAAQLKPYPPKPISFDPAKSAEKNVRATIKERTMQLEFDTDNKKSYALNNGIQEDVARRIWTKIKRLLISDENVTQIINMVFSEFAASEGTKMEGEMLLPFSKETLDILFNDDPSMLKDIVSDMMVSVTETLTDLFYWICRLSKQISKKHNLDNKTTSIKLTGSDYHVRGVGVCCLGFNGHEYIVKPNDRTFEKLVYGKKLDGLESTGNNTSLAEIFSQIVKPFDDLNHPDAKVGELGVETTPDHGSIFEFFPHKQLSKITKEKQSEINKASLINVITFSSLLGLADLHGENLVYGSDLRPQIIDGEVGIKFLMKKEDNEGNLPLSSVIKQGEMRCQISSLPPEFNFDFKSLHQEKYIDSLIDFLQTAWFKLHGQRCRIVIIITKTLYAWRDMFYRKQRAQKPEEKFSFSCYLMELLGFIENNKKTGGKGKLENTVYKAYESTLKDFRKGRIPYFELELDTGNIYQKFTDGELLLISDPEKSLVSFLNKNIRLLIDLRKQISQDKEKNTACRVGSTMAIAAAIAGSAIYLIQQLNQYEK